MLVKRRLHEHHDVKWERKERISRVPTMSGISDGIAPLFPSPHSPPPSISKIEREKREEKEEINFICGYAFCMVTEKGRKKNLNFQKTGGKPQSDYSNSRQSEKP
uniref:Uncharacterized protein n=1 Tax=Pristionchus pacificus TaxID=54126 RepID=A0A2A6BCC2_PRIPA|eukprot:PDM63542.1 hypothetical protein PRIPAC_49434 [Pristionchus pacificus]